MNVKKANIRGSNPMSAAFGRKMEFTLVSAEGTVRASDGLLPAADKLEICKVIEAIWPY